MAGPKLLFIEDDPALSAMYRLSLEHAGYSVTLAEDGERGLELARQLLPDLLFLDIRLPKLDGLAVLRELRSDPGTAAMPVVVLSNYGDAETVQAALDLGASEYLIKSQTNPILVAAEIPNWLAGQPAG